MSEAAAKAARLSSASVPDASPFPSVAIFAYACRHAYCDTPVLRTPCARPFCIALPGSDSK